LNSGNIAGMCIFIQYSRAEGIGQKLVLRIREKVKYFVNCAKK
jgi:hypothetical protein